MSPLPPSASRTPFDQESGSLPPSSETCCVHDVLEYAKFLREAKDWVARAEVRAPDEPTGWIDLTFNSITTNIEKLQEDLERRVGQAVLNGELELAMT